MEMQTIILPGGRFFYLLSFDVGGGPRQPAFVAADEVETFLEARGDVGHVRALQDVEAAREPERAADVAEAKARGR